MVNKAKQVEEGEDVEEEVRTDLGKKTMERRETSLWKNIKEGGNLSVGRSMRQSRLTIKKQIKTFKKSWKSWKIRSWKNRQTLRWMSGNLNS